MSSIILCQPQYITNLGKIKTDPLSFHLQLAAPKKTVKPESSTNRDIVTWMSYLNTSGTTTSVPGNPLVVCPERRARL